MYNLFKVLEKTARLMSNSPDKHYWEYDDNNHFGKNLSPDNIEYDEEELFESIRESDRQRLLKS